MPRQYPYQVNFRCSEIEVGAYAQLAEDRETPLAQIIRKQLNKLVRKHLGDDWLEE